jgi:hypothetical protein
MRIDQLGRPVSQASARTRRKQEGFSVSDDAAPREAPAAAAPDATVDIAALTSSAEPQPASSAREQDQAAAQHGDAMLKGLEQLQLASLGQDAEAARSSLAALAGSLKPAADPTLNALLHGIAARAAVEMSRSG